MDAFLAAMPDLDILPATLPRPMIAPFQSAQREIPNDDDQKGRAGRGWDSLRLARADRRANGGSRNSEQRGRLQGGNRYGSAHTADYLPTTASGTEGSD